MSCTSASATSRRPARLGVGLLALVSGVGAVGLLGAGTALADTCTAGPGTSTQNADGCSARSDGTDNEVIAGNDRGDDGGGVGTAHATARGTGHRVQAYAGGGTRGHADAASTGTDNQVLAVGDTDGRGHARARGTNAVALGIGVDGGTATATSRDSRVLVQVFGEFDGVGSARSGGQTSILTDSSSSVARSRDGGSAGVRDTNGFGEPDLPLGVSCTGQALALNRTTGEYCVSNARRTIRRDADGQITVTPATTTPRLVSLRRRP